MSTLTEVTFQAAGTTRSVQVSHDEGAGVVLVAEDAHSVTVVELGDEHLQTVLAGLVLGLARLRGVVPVDAVPAGSLFVAVGTDGTVQVAANLAAWEVGH